MFDIYADLFTNDGEPDNETSDAYFDDLMGAFVESPEGKALDEAGGELHWASSMAGYGMDYLGVSPGDMSVGNFREILFELFPRKISVDPEKSGEIVRSLRAFWQFCGREYNLPQAAEIVELLDGEGAKQFQEKMADPASYGMAKSMFMSGQEAGFDMTTQEGMNKFMLAYNSQLLQRHQQASESRSVRVDTATDRRAQRGARKKLLARKKKRRSH